MLCRGCGQYWHGDVPGVLCEQADVCDWGCDMDCALSDIWGGWDDDYLAPYYVARELGAGAQEACVSADGERVEDAACGGVDNIYGIAIGYIFDSDICDTR